jgi:hypothetical protein
VFKEKRRRNGAAACDGIILMWSEGLHGSELRYIYPVAGSEFRSAIRTEQEPDIDGIGDLFLR